MSTMVAQGQRRAEEDGVILSPEEEEDFEQMIAETDAEERAGRVHTLEEIRALLGAP